MSKNEYKARKCKICGKEFYGVISYCSLECLHESSRAHGDYLQKRKILDFMLENPQISSREIARIFNVGKSVTERLSFFTDRKRIKYEVDENFFEVIDTEEKAYWLGFLYADGYVKKRQSNSCIIELSLAEIDYNHVLKFKNSLKSNYAISKKIVKLQNKEFVAYRFSIYREKMYMDLVNKGCVENKSLILKFPEYTIFSNQDLVKHFIRGYVDGDGSLGIYNGRGSVSILGTEHMLNGILSVLKSQSITTKSIPHRCTTQGKTNIFELKLNGLCSAKTAEYLYKNSHIYLDRKYKKYLQIKDIYKDVL